MLSATDVHYLTGFMYLTTGSSDIMVTLGEKVWDQAAEEGRDVDIVVAEAGQLGLIGVEVKDEGRPLHTGLIEALCQKFSDMPAIRERYVVSSSGFSGPALRKADAHGVKCMRFVRGRLPRFATVDLSKLNECTIQTLEWREGPTVTLAPRQHLSREQNAEINDYSAVRCATSTVTSPKTVRELADRVAAAGTAAWSGPEHSHGLIPVDLTVELEDEPTVCLKSGEIKVGDVPTDVEIRRRLG